MTHRTLLAAAALALTAPGAALAQFAPADPVPAPAPAPEPMAEAPLAVVDPNALCQFDDGAGTEGRFECRFTQTADDGSFLVIGPGQTAFSLEMQSRGVGIVTDYYTGTGVSMGRFDRETEDRACWGNRQTGARVCAW